MKKKSILAVMMAAALALTAAVPGQAAQWGGGQGGGGRQGGGMPAGPAPKPIEAEPGTILFQGHGSARIVTLDGTVVYVDPYTGDGYNEPADLILVTHQHPDHNQIDKPAKKDDVVILQNTDPDLVGMEIDVGWVAFAGADPAEIIKKYPGRFRIVHVKECNRVAKDAEEREHFPKKVLDMGPPKFINGAPKFSPEQEHLMYEARNFNVELGNGIINWAALTAAANSQGFPVYYVSEREYYHCYGADGNEEICAQKDCDFIHSL